MLLADGAAVAAIVTQGEEMASTLAQNVFQIGFVVPDIHKGMAFFKDKLGVPEFLFPQGGMHHYCTEVDNYAQGVKDMESCGFPLVQSGRRNETRFAYFDTTGMIGALTEIVYLQPEEKAFMQTLKHKSK